MISARLPPKNRRWFSITLSIVYIPRFLKAGDRSAHIYLKDNVALTADFMWTGHIKLKIIQKSIKVMLNLIKSQ